MGTWKVKKYITLNGKCPIDKWLDGLSDCDLAKVDTVIEAIESSEQIPPETVKKFKGTNLYEVKISGDKKALRPFAVKDGGKKELILLSGSVKKGGKIKPGDVESAEKLCKDWSNGDGSKKDYWED